MTYTSYLEWPGGYRAVGQGDTVEEAEAAFASADMTDVPALHCRTILPTEAGPPKVEARLDHPYATLAFEPCESSSGQIKYSGDSRRRYIAMRRGVAIARHKAMARERLMEMRA